MTPPGAPVPPSPAVVKAAEAAWARYASTVRLGGTSLQRGWAFRCALDAERRLWSAEGSGAATA